MSQYAQIINGTVQRIITLDDAWYASLVASGNPKANMYLPISEESAPLYDDSSEVIFDEYTINGSVVNRTWSVRAKTEEELLQESTRTYTAYEFLLRLTAEERAAIRAAAQSDVLVADFLQLAQAAQEITTTDPTTVAGMGYLVFAGLLTAERKDEILS